MATRKKAKGKSRLRVRSAVDRSSGQISVKNFWCVADSGIAVQPDRSAIQFLRLQGDAHERRAEYFCRADRQRGIPVRRGQIAWSHGKMTFPAATSRREKMRCDLFTGSSMTAQFR